MNNLNVVLLQEIKDERGKMLVVEGTKNLPFAVKRAYILYAACENCERGGHAHKNLKQLFICLQGSCTVTFDNGEEIVEIQLSNNNRGILVEGVVWREIHNMTKDCVLMVFADATYDEMDYIRSYENFKAYAAK